MEFNEEAHYMDILSREWINDFSSLSNKEINNILITIFYQLFMIELDSIEITSTIDELGNHVTFRLEGEAFRDSDTIINVGDDITEDD